MAVNWQTVEIPFGGGINTKPDYKRLQPPFVQDIQNLVFTEAPGYKLRFGSTNLSTEISTGATLSTASALVTHRNQLLLFNDTELYSYDTVQTEWNTSTNLNSITIPKITEKAVAASLSNQTIGSSWTLSGVRLSAWLEEIGTGSGSLFAAAQDESTGAFLYGPVSIGAATSVDRPFVIASASNLYIIYYDATATSLKYRKMSPTSPDTLAAAVTMVSDTGSGVYDVCRSPASANTFLIAYRRNNAGTPNLSGFTFTASTDTVGTVRTINSTAGERAVSVINIAANLTYAFIVACDTSGPLLYVERTDLTMQNRSQLATTAVAATNATLCISPLDTGSWGAGLTKTCVWETAASAVAHTTFYSHAGATPFTAPTTLFKMGITSKGWVTNSNNLVIVTKNTAVLNETNGTQNTDFVLLFRSASTARPVGRIASGLSYYTTSRKLANPVESSTAGMFDIPLPVATRAAIVSEDFLGTQIRLFRLDFVSTGRYQFVEAGGATYISGGNTLFEFDGVNLVENNFLIYPENIAGTPSNPGTGDLEPSKTYNYRVYFEWYNAFGERKRSSTAEVISVDTGVADDIITLSIPTLNMTWTETGNETPVSIVVYRSEADADVVGGAPFYRASSASPTSTGANSYVENDSTTATVSFVDGMADAELITNELDYLNTGELDNIAAPVGEVIGQAKGRIWVAGGIDKNQVFFSKLRFPGETVSFNEANSLSIPDDADPNGVTAIAELTYFTVLFKSDSIWAVSGDGPDNLGRGFFNEPQHVTSDVGCTEPRSVVAFDGGLLFKSDKGIYSLGQNLQVQYVGAPVEAYNSQNITSATLVNNQNQVRFLTSSGRMLVYDYLVNQWTTFTGWTGVSAVNWRASDLYTWATAAGAVTYENSAVFTDNGTEYRGLFRTAPITLRGLGGYFKMKRVIFLGEYYTAHTLDVVVNYDFATDQATDSWASTSADHTNGYEVIYNLPRQKFSSVEFQVTVNPTSAGRGAEIDAMTAEVAYHPGLNRLPAGNKFGS